MRFHGIFGIVLAGLVAGTSVSVMVGCVGGSKGLSSEDKEKLKAYILDAPPADMPHKLDVNFENKVHLIGYKFEPETAKPGQEAKLTYYWRCDEPLDDGWLLFTHTKDDGTGKMGNLDYVGPLRDQRNGSHQVLGPGALGEGQDLRRRADLQGARRRDGLRRSPIIVGIWKGDARLRIISGPNDGDNSAIVGKMNTGIGRRRARTRRTANDVPTLTVNKLAKNDAIKIDGKGDEPEWGAAASTGPFVDVGTGKPNTPFPRERLRPSWPGTTTTSTSLFPVTSPPAHLLHRLHRRQVAAQRLHGHAASRSSGPRTPSR